jgi:hypothetical protein
LERDLHDAVQQELVALALQLRTAEMSVPAQLHRSKVRFPVSQEIWPALARRSAVPVQLDL